MQVLIADSDIQHAKRVESLVKEFLGVKENQITLKSTRGEVLDHIQNHVVDLLISEVNLDGFSIFKLLKEEQAKTFRTILMSNRIDLAHEAFNYNVLDFIIKPFDRNRLKQSLERYRNVNWATTHSLEYLAIKNSTNLKVIKTDSINYLEGLRSYVKVHLRDGRYEITDKSLETLEKIIPDKFKRIHRSYIVNSEVIDSFAKKDNRNLCILVDQQVLPISSSRYSQIVNNFVR